MLFLYRIWNDTGIQALRINTLISLFYFVGEQIEKTTFPTLTIRTLLSAQVIRKQKKTTQPKHSKISQVWTK